MSLPGCSACFTRKKEPKSLDQEIEALIARRAEAPENKDWATADAIRDELKAKT